MSLATVWSLMLMLLHLLLLLLVHLVLLQFVLRKAPENGTSERAQKSMAGLMASVAACQSACDGTSESAFAFSGRLTALRVLVGILAIMPGVQISHKRRSLVCGYGISDSLLLLIVWLLSLIVFLAVRLLLRVLLPIRAQLLVLTVVLL